MNRLKGPPVPDIPRSILVFCGSRPGRNPAYAADARNLGRGIAENGWRLVYGAGDVGIMGEVARAAQAAGGRTFGVIPGHLFDREVGKTDLDTFVVTETMHERKKVMLMNSDAVVLLPGGLGSLDEFFEVVTWKQLGLHDKPIVVLNTAGYWDALEGLVDQVIAEGFAEESCRGFYSVVDSADAALEALG